MQTTFFLSNQKVGGEVCKFVWFVVFVNVNGVRVIINLLINLINIYTYIYNKYTNLLLLVTYIIDLI